MTCFLFIFWELLSHSQNFHEILPSTIAFFDTMQYIYLYPLSRDHISLNLSVVACMIPVLFACVPHFFRENSLDKQISYWKIIQMCVILFISVLFERKFLP